MIAGGNFMDGFRQGIITAGLNHVAHLGAVALMSKGPGKFVVAGIYGAGGDTAGDNPLLEEIVEGEGGTMFTSYVGEGDKEIIDFLKQGYEEGKGIKIYGYSRGGNAGIRITNKLGEMGINVFQLVTFDPHSITDGGLELKYNNVAYFYNYFQRNPRTGWWWGWWGKNPYNGSRVKVNPDFNVEGFQKGYTGQYYKDGNLVSHLNIISHVYGR